MVTDFIHQSTASGQLKAGKNFVSMLEAYWGVIQESVAKRRGLEEKESI